MQDWASQAQSVLGNKYPDSGTAGRLMLGAGGLASGAVSPLIPAGLLGGAAAYIPAIQKLLVGSVANRPAAAAKIAGLLGDSAPMLAPIGNAAAQSVVPAAAAKIAGLLGDSAPMLAPIGNAAAQSVVNQR